MSYSYNTMLGDTTDTITVIGASGPPVYTISTNNSTAGQTLTSGTGGLYWGTSNGSANWVTADTSLNGDSLKVKGNADFEGDVKIKGKSIVDMFENIEERLAILHPNPELEEKWENLRGLRNAYVELEKEIKEKEAMWAILKK